MPRGGLSYRGKALLRTTSQSASQTAPLLGELSNGVRLRGCTKTGLSIAVRRLRRQRPRPLSRACARQLPQRGSHWHVGQLSSGRAKHNISEAAVLRCPGQRQLDKERCPEAAVPISKARPFTSCRASGVQWKVIRPAKASPFGRGVTEGDGEGAPGQCHACGVTERASVNLWKMHE